MELTSYVIIGVIVSVIVQFLKKKFGTNTQATLVAVIVISILAGSTYFMIKETSLWQPIVSILGFAGAVYTYIIQRFED